MTFEQILVKVVGETNAEQTSDAASFHKAVANGLEKHNCLVFWEQYVPYASTTGKSRNGKVDLMAKTTDDPTLYAIELDNLSARKKSIEKIKNHGQGYVVLRATKDVYRV